MKLKLLIIWLFVLFQSCYKEQWDDCFTSKGKTGTEYRVLANFQKIKVSNRFNVVLSQNTSNPESITLRGGKNLFKGIKTTIKKGELQIDDINTCNFVRDMKQIITLEINIHNIDEITVSGATGITTSDTLKLGNLNLSQSALSDLYLQLEADIVSVVSLNSGSVRLSGRARKITASVEEITDLDARNLVCEEAFVDSHTAWPVYINASKIIYVNIYNSGNIYYVKKASEVHAVKEKLGSGNLLLLE
jgi:hypothetical protein